MTQNHVNRISGRSECLAWRFVCWRHELWSTSWHRACLAQEAQWRQDVPATCWMLMGQMICRKRQWREWQCVLMSENNRYWKLSPLGHLPPEERLSWSTSELDLGLLPPFLGYRNFRRLWSISAKRKTNRKKTNRIKHPFKKKLPWNKQNEKEKKEYSGTRKIKTWSLQFRAFEKDYHLCSQKVLPRFCVHVQHPTQWVSKAWYQPPAVVSPVAIHWWLKGLLPKKIEQSKKMQKVLPNLDILKMQFFSFSLLWDKNQHPFPQPLSIRFCLDSKDLSSPQPRLSHTAYLFENVPFEADVSDVEPLAKSSTAKAMVVLLTQAPFISVLFPPTAPSRKTCRVHWKSVTRA